MKLILQKAPAKFFRLWTAKSWGPVPCMGGTWWLRVGQLYWQPSSSHLRRSPGGSTLGFRERHVTQGSSLENKVTQGVRVLSEEQKIGKTLNTRATRAETERAFMGELEAEETRLAQKLLWVVLSAKHLTPCCLSGKTWENVSATELLCSIWNSAKHNESGSCYKIQIKSYSFSIYVQGNISLP